MNFQSYILYSPDEKYYIFHICVNAASKFTTIFNSYSIYPTFKNAGCFELFYSISVVSSFKKLAQLTSFALTTQQLTNNE